MATKKATTQSFDVTAKVTVEMNVSVKANTYTEAIEEAKKLTWQDFVEPIGECFDHSDPVILSISAYATGAAL